ncbi:MAG TPA: exodeoxyribonuclease III [Gammaproteobacteria bacterium]|nr:exodeoxyribonuclease III [Gammaproteobacteria bacterium]
MTTIVSMNLNGIRSAAKKGFFEWVQQHQPDIVCVQETKAHTCDLDASIWHVQGYHSYFVDADKKGYSGVGILTKHKPSKVIEKSGHALADTEGRFICLCFGSLKVISLYLPSGTSGDHRQTVKYEMMDFFYDEWLVKHVNESMIIAGDWNIAHRNIDIKNWKGNQKNSGFLPQERAWLDRVESLGWVDAFRKINPEPDQYTWWSFRGQARVKNVGWRIDYQWVTLALSGAMVSVQIFPTPLYADHAPLMVEYNDILTQGL